MPKTLTTFEMSEKKNAGIFQQPYVEDNTKHRIENLVFLQNL